ncbi:hypothetical protein AAC387_Pa09g0321 [Persea americana]
MALAKTTSQGIAYKHPTFPILTLPHHFGDYGFDPHIHNFQASSEEPRRTKRETTVLGFLHSKQQKPISKEGSKNKNKKKRWWRNALLFWKWKSSEDEQQPHDLHHQGVEHRHMYRVEPGSETPSRSGRSSPKPVAGSLTPRRKGEVETRYLSLRELNLKPQERWISNSSMPIYMVT